jgi:hypothetical protein
MTKPAKSVAAVLAICVLGASAPVSSAAGATATAANTITIHCGQYLFARSIKISGPSIVPHNDRNCDTAHHVIKEGKLSEDRKNFSSPGWNCSRAPTRPGPSTFHCSKRRVLLEFDV